MNPMITEYKEFQFNNNRIILDIRRNQLFQLDDVSACLLRTLSRRPQEQDVVIVEMEKDYPKKEVQEALEELKELGLIRKEDEELTQAKAPQLPGIKALCFNVVHRCNLKCHYCYGKGGEYNTPGESMSYSTAVKAINFLFQQLPPGERGSIFLFGGEPLLCWDLLKKIIPYIRRREKKEKKRIHLSLTTNGTLLTAEIIDFLRYHRVGVMLSIDGPPHIHDRRRVFPDGSGTYSHILPRIKGLLQKQKRTSIRATLDPEEPRLMEVVDHLLQLGDILLIAEPSSHSIDEKSNGLSPRAIESLKHDYHRLKEKFIRTLEEESRLLPLFTFIRILRMLGGTGERRFYGCGMSTFYLALSPRGEFYPCHRFVDEKGYLLGNVQDGISAEARRRFLDLHVHQRPGCRTCWARYLCGGGCYYEAAAYGDIYKPYPARCQLIKEVITAAVEIGTYLGKIPPRELKQMTERLEAAASYLK